MIKRTWNLYEPLLVCDANLIRSPGPCNRFLPNPDPGWCRLVQPRVTTDTTPTLVTRDLLVELDDELLVPRSLAADQGYITPYSGNTRCPPPPAVESNHPRRSQGVFGLAHTPVPIWAPPTTIGEPPVQGIRPQLAPWRRRPPACLPSPPSRIDARLLGFSPSAPCQTHLPLPDLDHRWTPCEEDAALLGPPLPASKSSDSSALTSSRRGLWPGNHRQSPWKDTIRRLSFDLFPGDDLSEAASDTTTASPFRMALSKLPNLCPGAKIVLLGIRASLLLQLSNSLFSSRRY